MMLLFCLYWSCLLGVLIEVCQLSYSSQWFHHISPEIALIRSALLSDGFIGIVSDRGLLLWFNSYAAATPSLQNFFSNPLKSLALPSLHLYSAVVGTTAASTVLDAMKLMSEEGVSSVAVMDDDRGSLLSTVSVTDIGKVTSNNFWIYNGSFRSANSQIIIPSQTKHILTTPLHQLISYIKVKSLGALVI